MVCAADKKGFDLDKSIRSIDVHYLKDGVDFVNVDIRKLGNESKEIVKNTLVEKVKLIRLEQ